MVRSLNAKGSKMFLPNKPDTPTVSRPNGHGATPDQTSPCPMPPTIHGLSNHEYWAQRFEHEGYAAYPTGTNPYRPDTMAGSRWAIGYAKAQPATIPD